MRLYLSKLNILHHENCPCCNYKVLMKFDKPKDQSDFNFLILTVIYLANIENPILVEICPHCLGKSFNLLLTEFN